MLSRVSLAISGIVTGFFLANIYFYPPSLSRIRNIESLQGLPTEMYHKAPNHNSTSPFPDTWIVVLVIFAVAVSLFSIFWLAFSWKQTNKKKQNTHHNFTKRKINLSIYLVFMFKHYSRTDTHFSKTV